jgi:hypothetical protein
MIAVTTARRDGGVIKKQFSWSYSRLKNFETCPKRHWHIDIQKDVKEEESEALTYGNNVHTVMAHYIEKGTQMPPVLEPKLKPWADKVFEFKGIDVRTKGAKVFVEQKLAITEDFAACEFFDKQAWFRGIGDVMWTLGPLGYIGDWKTGKIVEDSQQLFLMAQCMFARHPELQIIRSAFIWLKDDADTTADIKRSDLAKGWANLLPRVAALKQAHDTTNYPARPGGLCRKWCPVTQCPHHGS